MAESAKTQMVDIPQKFDNYWASESFGRLQNAIDTAIQAAGLGTHFWGLYAPAGAFSAEPLAHGAMRTVAARTLSATAIGAGGITWAITVMSIGSVVVSLGVAMGMPYVEASQTLARQGMRQGFAIGLTAALFEQSTVFLRNEFGIRGFPSGLVFYKHQAFNQGLMAGYATGRRISLKGREGLRLQLATELDAFAAAQVETASWRTFVLHLARVLDKNHIR